MRRLASERGFTLFDVLQASALSTIAMVGVSSLLLSTMQATVRGRDITTAATVAEAKIEELRGTPFAGLADGSDVVTSTETPFTRSWRVTAGPTTGSRLVMVSVEWAGQGIGGIELQTIISD